MSDFVMVPIEATAEMLAAAVPFPDHLVHEHPDSDDPWHSAMFVATLADRAAAAATWRAMVRGYIRSQRVLG